MRTATQPAVDGRQAARLQRPPRQWLGKPVDLNEHDARNVARLSRRRAASGAEHVGDEPVVVACVQEPADDADQHGVQPCGPERRPEPRQADSGRHLQGDVKDDRLGDQPYGDHPDPPDGGCQQCEDRTQRSRNCGDHERREQAVPGAGHRDTGDDRKCQPQHGCAGQQQHGQRANARPVPRRPRGRFGHG